MCPVDFLTPTVSSEDRQSKKAASVIYGTVEQLMFLWSNYGTLEQLETSGHKVTLCEKVRLGEMKLEGRGGM